MGDDTVTGNVTIKLVYTPHNSHRFPENKPKKVRRIEKQIPHPEDVVAILLVEGNFHGNFREISMKFQ